MAATPQPAGTYDSSKSELGCLIRISVFVERLGVRTFEFPNMALERLTSSIVSVCTLDRLYRSVAII